MEQVVVEMFSNVPNNAVVRLPGRRFPGVVVQGDSLSILCDGAKAVVESLTAARRAGLAGLDDALTYAEELHALLRERQTAYEACLRGHAIPLPY